jgi:DNA-binding transcriptional MerR regulator
MQTIELNDTYYAALIQICNRNYRTADLQIKQWIDREARNLGINIPKIPPRADIQTPRTETPPQATKKIKVARKWTPEQREAARQRMKTQWETGSIKNRHLEKALEGAYDD